jgi:cell wall-associated NlpC family hydrolase
VRSFPRRYQKPLVITALCCAFAARGEAQVAAASVVPTAVVADSAPGPMAQKKPFAAFSASLTALRDTLVATARSQIGTRYKLGGDKPGRELDCSAFVRFVMSALDIPLPRTARQQATIGEAVPKDLNKLKPGDLLTFGRGKKITHIGIYVGDGRMVHASTTGKRVLETAVTTRNPLIRQWKGVRRVVGTTKDSLLALAAAAEVEK